MSAVSTFMGPAQKNITYRQLAVLALLASPGLAGIGIVLARLLFYERGETSPVVAQLAEVLQYLIVVSQICLVPVWLMRGPVGFKIAVTAVNLWHWILGFVLLFGSGYVG